MVDSTPQPPSSETKSGVTTYTNVQTVITPEAPGHYAVEVREADATTRTHAVERIVVNAAEISLEDPIWFVDAKVDVGVPVDGHGEVVWVWV
jgi:hypothetical protein